MISNEGVTSVNNMCSTILLLHLPDVHWNEASVERGNDSFAFIEHREQGRLCR